MLRQGLQLPEMIAVKRELVRVVTGVWVGEHWNRSMEEFNTNCQNQSKSLSDMGSIFTRFDVIMITGKRGPMKLWCVGVGRGCSIRSTWDVNTSFATEEITNILWQGAWRVLQRRLNFWY